MKTSTTMRLTIGEPLEVRVSDDVVRARQRVREHAVALSFSLVEQTKIVTAASELARNALVYGGGGEISIEVVEAGGRRGLRVVFEDRGPGHRDIHPAHSAGFTTGRGLGIGLGGARRLSDEFEISSVVGEGTRVAITRWKSR